MSAIPNTETTHDTEATHGVVASADGTPIAWTRLGSGPPIVMVHCVGVSRATTPQPTLPGALAEHFTVLSYDRRGKGESGPGDTAEGYAVERELEDLAAVLELVGEGATLYGFSSGATLALIAAEAGAAVGRLALLEPPLFPEEDPELVLRAEAERQLETGPEVAHRWFNTQIVGVPDEVLEQLPPPSEEDLRNVRTITHELTFLPGTPAERFAGVGQPTLLVASDATAPEIHEWAQALETALPRARRAVLPGEWHGVDDATLTWAIVGFVESVANEGADR